MPRRPHAAATTRIIVNGLTAASVFGLVAVIASEAPPAASTTGAAPTGASDRKSTRLNSSH